MAIIDTLMHLKFYAPQLSAHQNAKCCTKHYSSVISVIHSIVTCGPHVVWRYRISKACSALVNLTAASTSQRALCCKLFTLHSIFDVHHLGIVSACLRLTVRGPIERGTPVVEHAFCGRYLPTHYNICFFLVHVYSSSHIWSTRKCLIQAKFN